MRGPFSHKQRGRTDPCYRKKGPSRARHRAHFFSPLGGDKGGKGSVYGPREKKHRSEWERRFSRVGAAGGRGHGLCGLDYNLETKIVSSLEVTCHFFGRVSALCKTELNSG